MSNKDRIFIYNNTLFSISQTFIYHQAACLTDKFDVFLIARNFVNPHDFDFKIFDSLKIDYPSNRFSAKFSDYYFNSSINISFKSYIKLRKLLKDKRCRAIHAHFGPRALEILGLARKLDIPLIVTFHGYDASQFLNYKKYAEKLPDLFKYASAIIIVSSHMIDTLKLDPWLDKVHLIPCSVNPDEFPNSTGMHDVDVIKIIHSGRMVPKKGVQDLIRVFSELENKYGNIELHLIGDGEELQTSKKLANDLGLDNKIHFYGAAPHEKVKKLLNEADIFVLNSRTDQDGDMEGTPVSILEAMCMGKAVVSTRHAGIPDIIEHGENGLLANEYMNNELKFNIEKLIMNQKLRESLGKEAEKTIRKSFTTNVMQKKILKIFESI